MASHHGVEAVHWDHEPTPDPSQEGNGLGPDERLLPCWQGLGVGRFMESLTSFWARIGTMNCGGFVAQAFEPAGSPDFSVR